MKKIKYANIQKKGIMNMDENLATPSSVESLKL